MNRTRMPLVAAGFAAALGVGMVGATSASAQTPTPPPVSVIQVADPGLGGSPTTGPGQIAPTAIPTIAPTQAAATSTPTAAVTSTPTATRTIAPATPTVAPATPTVAQPSATVAPPTVAATAVARATPPAPRVGNGPVGQRDSSLFLGLGAMLAAAGILLGSAWTYVQRRRR